MFIHGPDLLIDTPEEISLQLNRSTVTEIRAGLYSHWHPGHSSGKREFEMYKDWVDLQILANDREATHDGYSIRPIQLAHDTALYKI